MKTEIIIIGACGRMGRHLIAAVNETRTARLAGAVEIKGHKLIGSDAGECAGVGRLGCIISDDLEKVLQKGQVVIDFSQAEATIKNLRTIVAGKAKAVIGTTGLSEKQRQEIKAASKKTAVMFASNMSIGMNLLFKLTRDVAAFLGQDYDIEIVEAHHRFKKDAPSGSAKTLAEMAAAGLHQNLKDTGIYGRNGMVGERKRGEIGVHAVRAGDIIGDHTVMFGALGERLELRHQAHSRETFARGAVRAALWLANKRSGLFDMQDVLGLR